MCERLELIACSRQAIQS